MTSRIKTEAAVVVVALRGLERFRESGEQKILRVQDCGRAPWRYAGGSVFRVPNGNSIGEDGRPLFRVGDDSQ